MSYLEPCIGMFYLGVMGQGTPRGGLPVWKLAQVECVVVSNVMRLGIQGLMLRMSLRFTSKSLGRTRRL